MTKIILKSKEYAIKCHREINHKYGEDPYEMHLEDTFNVGIRFSHLIPVEDIEDVLSGCWVHDLLEDTHETWNNVCKILGETIAEYSYRLQNEKGRNRVERANAKYYNEIKEYKHALFIKLCDRIANTEHSLSTNHGMFNKYKKEFDHFYESLYDGRYEEMWNYLKNLYNE